jgi:TPR repeat protein
MNETMPSQPNQPSQPRHGVGVVVLCIVLLSLGLGFCLALWAPSPTPIAVADQPQQADAAAGLTPAQNCLRVAAKPPEFLDMEAKAFWRAEDAWADSCRQALADGDEDPRIKLALARAMRPEQRPEAVALLRQAAAQGNGEAAFRIFDSYRSWDQHGDREQLITRAEADRALHRSAELRYPEGMLKLAGRLDSGGIVKRDPAAALYWAQQMLDDPPKDVGRGSVQLFIGRLQANSADPEQRGRGLDLLERLDQIGLSGAKVELAVAVRRDDPVRARALLEQALRSDQLGAIPPLAQMLSRGEGGPADPKRAWSLVSGHNEIGAIEGMRGEFYLEGKLVPRDVAKAIDLIRHAAVWNYEPRLRVVQLLAANPGVRVDRAERILFDATEAAELDEPGALAALIDLKLSAHPQFHDPAGACKWLATAALRGDPAAAPRLADCPPT